MDDTLERLPYGGAYEDITNWQKDRGLWLRPSVPYVLFLYPINEKVIKRIYGLLVGAVRIFNYSTA